MSNLRDIDPAEYRKRAAAACTRASWLFAASKDQEARDELMKAVYASDRIKGQSKKKIRMLNNGRKS